MRAIQRLFISLILATYITTVVGCGGPSTEAPGHLEGKVKQTTADEIDLGFAIYKTEEQCLYLKQECKGSSKLDSLAQVGEQDTLERPLFVTLNNGASLSPLMVRRVQYLPDSTYAAQ